MSHLVGDMAPCHFSPHAGEGESGVGGVYPSDLPFLASPYDGGGGYSSTSGMHSQCFIGKGTPTRGQTRMTENITFPHTSTRAVNILGLCFYAIASSKSVFLGIHFELSRSLLLCVNKPTVLVLCCYAIANSKWAFLRIHFAFARREQTLNSQPTLSGRCLSEKR